MINVAVLGYGTVGSGVVEVLETNKESINKKAGQPIQIKYVLDLKDFPGNPVEKVLTKDFNDILNDDSVQIVAEVMGGVEPAYTFVKKCLMAGKSVVTSNKELVAKHGAELLEIAKGKNINFLFEASVGGGIPIIRPLNQSLTADEISEISGILNGTTNFILSKMAQEGLSFDAVLKEAQELGYAERNPAADVEGHDACRKIAILSSLAFGMHVDFEEIYTEGITKITDKDMAYAKALGYQIKLLASSKRVGDHVCAMVAPMMISENHPLSNVHGVFNAIFVKGNVIGDVMFYGRGAGKLPTASAVVADIVDAVKHLDRNIMTLWSTQKMDLMPVSDNEFIYFISAKTDFIEAAKDSISKLFGKVKYVSRPGQPDEEIAFITEAGIEKEMRDKLKALSEATSIISVDSAIRVEQ